MNDCTSQRQVPYSETSATARVLNSWHLRPWAWDNLLFQAHLPLSSVTHHCLSQPHAFPSLLLPMTCPFLPKPFPIHFFPTKACPIEPQLKSLLPLYHPWLRQFQTSLNSSYTTDQALPEGQFTGQYSIWWHGPRREHGWGRTGFCPLFSWFNISWQTFSVIKTNWSKSE